MKKDHFQILSTAPLSNQLIGRAATHNVSIEQISFIETVILENENIKNKIEDYIQQKTTAIFTSTNAADAVAKYIKEKPEWDIYCLANTTKMAVQNYFGLNSIAGFAANAGDLAELIPENTPQVIFFCGNQRRDELPVKLKEKNVFVEELVVYNTFETPVLLDTRYDGIMFFSPSAVNSFFSINRIDNKTQLFAIGKTTAAAIQQFTSNHVIVSDSPGKNNLVKMMIQYYSGLND